MRLFVEAELPDFCYVSEAAYWVALGRIPPDEREIGNALNGEYTAVNARLGEEATWNGQITNMEFGFSESELHAFGVKIDYSRYVEGINGTYGSPGDEYVAEQKRNVEEFVGRHGGNIVKSEAEKCGKDLLNEAVSAAQEFEWAKQHEEPLETVVDRARAVVFEALASGKISAKGWLEYTDEEMQKNDGDGPNGGRGGRFVEIQSNQWTLRHFDWDSLTLRSGDAEFSGPMVSVGSMLELFPTPICEMYEISGTMAAGSLILEGAGNSHPRKNARRGRPSKGDGLVRTALQNEFRARKARGELASKQEANIQAAIEWVQGILGTDVGRSSVQRWLKGII